MAEILTEITSEERSLIVSLLHTEWHRLDGARPQVFRDYGREPEQVLIRRQNEIDDLIRRLYES